MSGKVSLPKIDARKANDLLRQLRRMAPHYTREWPAKDETDPAVGLLKIFSTIAEGVISRLNRAPERNFLAFLDMLGIRLLPATPARAPVRFLLAKGTEDAVFVPRGTQVSAPANAQHPTELPFETMVDLSAIPATLTELFTVDPERDHIYKPPPKFLELELAAIELPTLKVTAFSAADSKFLQLEPPDQVKKDDFLRIDQTLDASSRGKDCLPATGLEQLRTSDHLVALDAKGSIITVADPLPRAYSEGTTVRKVTDFELFEARNWQEHVLYLAHDDYFAIKSEAKIELRVEHAGAAENLEPLDVIWEFFGVTATVKEDGWHRFEVETDQTLGFSRPGRLILNKPAGEIKQKEINGTKSRWIRARLNKPLPATPPPSLPKVESISFLVSTGGKDLPADQAFNNDTPLTLTPDVPFFPFGTEPRIFDRFSIASEEAFSKLGAEVSLTFSLDSTELLASPVAVVAKNRIRVFARGAAGKLLEFQVDPVTSDITPQGHGNPQDTRITAGSTPAVAIDANFGNIAVFAKADDGKIYLRYIPTAPDTKADWKALTITPGVLQFSPAATLDGAYWQVLAVVDNKLYRTFVNTAEPVAGGWNAILDSPRVDSTPFVLNDGGVVVFVTDQQHLTWMYRNVWTRLTPNISPDVATPNPDYLAADNARPFARAYTAGSTQQFRVYLRNRNDQLVVFDTGTGPSRNLLGPSARVGSNPYAPVLSAHDRIYVRGLEDNHLWSIKDADNEEWKDHETTDGINLNGDPFLIAFPPKTEDFVSAFTTSKKNALLEFRVGGANVASGKLDAGPNSIVLLEDPPPSSGTYYIHILSGPGSELSGGAVRKIKQQSTPRDFVVLESPLDESPTDRTEYSLLHQERIGFAASDATSTTLELQAGHGGQVQDGDYVFARDQLRRIPTAPASGDEVTIGDSWDTPPDSGDGYVLLRVEVGAQNKYAVGASDTRAVLDAGSQQANDFYNNRFLQITAGPGEGPEGRRIVDYFNATNNVVLDSEFFEHPTSDSSFAITVSSVREAWYVHKDPDQEELRPQLSWEYWNGRGWVALAIEKDGTEKLLVEGSVKFTIPQDIAKTEVAGQENFWIRARIVGGDYGRELFTFDQATKEIKIEKDPIRPPIVNNLSLQYQLTEEKPPQFCLTFNNLDYLDQTAANVTADKHFNPYLPLRDTGKAVYFGFDKSFEGGPIRLYFATKELEIDETNKPKLAWEFGSDNSWKPLPADDKTKAFTKPDFVSFVLPDGFQNSQEFGKALYWLRATLIRGSWKDSPLFKGVFPNTVAALQARTVRNEILGSSTSIKNQRFRFQQVPVLEGEDVRVREALTDVEREELVSTRGRDAVLEIKDQRDEVLQTWVKWTEVLEFFDSKSDSRHYRLDRATGEIEFGDGVRGRIPPAGGDNLQAFSYQTGGGALGNVLPGEIKSTVTAVGGVDSVLNPVAAGGGSDKATNEEMMEIGPAQISHRERAVTPEDFEELAREASREVRKSLCLPNRNPGGRPESGWTSVHIVPNSKDAAPMPSLELRRAVQRYLAQRADVTLVDQDHIFVGPPKYVPVSVAVTVFAKSLDVVGPAEQNVKRKLEQFLHPLTGGPASEGWEFGRDLAASDLYLLLEDIEEVDHVGPLRLMFGDTESEDRVEVDADALIASGTHAIDMSVATENG
jgi:hypothetical protein